MRYHETVCQPGRNITSRLTMELVRNGHIFMIIFPEVPKAGPISDPHHIILFGNVIGKRFQGDPGMFAVRINPGPLLEYTVPVFYREGPPGLNIMNIVTPAFLFQDFWIYAIGEQLVIILHIQDNIQYLDSV